MVKRIIILLVIVFFAIIIFPLLKVDPTDSLSSLATKYIRDGADELGSANLVTSIVVTYRGLDTLGEVAVLFIATAGVGFLLRKKKNSSANKRRKSSEILSSGTSFLVPIIFLFGVYIFTHGHLTPGGGFQGGVVIASGVLLLMLSDVSLKFNHFLLSAIESFSGFFYIIIGILGLFLAGGFLDNRIFSLGTFGNIFSAGAIPIIYSLLGIKVGSELVGILGNLRDSE
ncbi:MAG: Na(+)/H(+) antiporter subunit B [Candidatus Cloacimonetes bacterium]|nr:Na(+)/H(+) antiporter subunit B [Candidatus Cloacimonadota bacterium]